MRSILALLALIVSGPALAQSRGNSTALIVSACGALPSTMTVGNTAYLTMDTTGKLCTGTTGSVAALTLRNFPTMTGFVVATCGNQTYTAGRSGVLTLDPNGNLCQ